MANCIRDILNPLYLLFQKITHLDLLQALIYVISAVIVFSVIYFSTSKSFWIEQKRLYYKTAIWLSAITFGLIHLIAFSNSSLLLVPYMLCVVTVPFFAGCAITYYRINLGFWWGVGLHIFNNIPPFLIMILNFYK